MKKIKAAILGPGNIGCDLLVKMLRSPWLECTLLAGRSMNTRGMKFAEKKGIAISADSVHAIEKNPSCCDIVFDATNAEAHKEHAPILEKLSKYTIDLTPALVGKMCVPVLNAQECLKEKNVNMITCGGQATVPLAYAINLVHPNDTKYIEIVAGISSRSAGPGTRANIDEFTQTTGDALKCFTKAQDTKAIIILNSAEPPIHMHNTIYAIVEKPNMPEIIKSVREMEAKIKKYVPGYKILYDPVFENGRVTTSIEVIGQGDYLPSYAGNLDIITCAAIDVAEKYAQQFIRERG